MPSSSKKQHNFMAAIAHNPAFAKKVGIPQSVGKDFDEADKGKKFGSGGRTRPDVQKVNKSKTDHGKMTFFKEGGDTMASKMNAGMMAIMAKKKGATKMAGGGMPMKDGKPAFIGDGKGMKKGGMAMGKVKTAAPSRDGIAEKGKTKGKMIAMKMGGKTC
jgi:hypothetical protein